jgi:capsular exopolysaccharide synthesis family protein
MDSGSNKGSKQNSGGGYGYYNYGGNYAGYSAVGYGYGYGSGESQSAQRGFQDYLLILRERIWYIVVVFLVIFSSSLVYTLSQTKVYQSSTTVQVFRRDPTVMQVQAVTDNEIRSAEDLNTQVKLMESSAIIQKVSERLTGDELKQFMEPYSSSASDTLLPVDILAKNRKILPQRLTLIIQVLYQHPNRFIAAKVANYFADEFIAYNARVRIDESMKAVEELKNHADEQRRKVAQMAVNLQSYRERNNMVSLDQRKDIVTEKLKALNLYVTQTSAKLKEAEIRWSQVKEHKTSGASLSELPFVASQPLIAQLTQQLAAQKIVIAQMRDRYREKHPKMQEAANSLAQAERELAKATDSVCAQVESDYLNNLRSDREAREALAKQEIESLDLDRAAVEYSNQERDFKINDQILQNIITRSRETTMTSTIETQNARIVDRAAPSPASKPISPNVSLNLGLGLIGGLGLGLAFAFFVAFVDDRVKSSFDIESVVGLPLVGIIPQIKRMEQPDKAQIVVNNSDRQVSEAFLTLHSSLRLKDESKKAKAILVTSTIPGEGKSFTTTNLALTFAAHGEKVVVVDCDLRKPNVHKSFRLENLKGVIDICSGSATIDDVVMKGVQPNLDVIAAGGRAKNPTHILNSKNFEQMISDLKKRYDRVFVDTPPLAAVSDALIILPLMDGSLFTIFFNKVRRKAAQFSAKKLLDANVPNFGAVLNGLNLAVSGYYYAQYYDKSYKDYYVVMAKEDSSEK